MFTHSSIARVYVIFVSRMTSRYLAVGVQSIAWSAILIGFGTRFFLVVNMIAWVFAGLSLQSLKYFRSDMILYVFGFCGAPW